MVSQRKQNANRQNAKNSTGPGDTRRTRFNALRHGMSAGFLSKEALIDGGPGKEDPEELEACARPSSIIGRPRASLKSSW